MSYQDVVEENERTDQENEGVTPRHLMTVIETDNMAPPRIAHLPTICLRLSRSVPLAFSAKSD
jgi:hypothetical protein